VLLGRNLRTQGLVCWDRWTQPNYNQVILARSGAGKSYLAKLEALRWLYQGVQVLVVDPENEYQRLAAAVGGAYLRLGHPGVHLNPLDLGSEPDAMTRPPMFAQT
jgi:type IV secretory pathway VirB4 component